MSKHISTIIFVFVVQFVSAQNHTLNGDSVELKMQWPTTNPTDGVYLCNGTNCNGILSAYDDSLRLKWQGYFKDGQGEGPGTWYYPSGKLKAIGNKNSNLTTGLFNEFYPNGRIKSISYNPTEASSCGSERQDYLANGQLINWVKYKSDWLLDFRYALSDEGDTLFKMTTSEEDSAIFNAFEYYDNGVLMSEGQLIFNPKSTEREIGVWRYYNADGTLKEEKDFGD